MICIPQIKNMSSSLLVAAVIKNTGLQSGPELVVIEKDGVQLTLNREDWIELTDTMKGNRHSNHSDIAEGTYSPERSYVYNHQTC